METHPLSIGGNARMNLTNDSFGKASETIREREAQLRMKKEFSNSHYYSQTLLHNLTVLRFSYRD